MGGITWFLGWLILGAGIVLFLILLAAAFGGPDE